ncbi:MAG: hypothetical protein KatS3mg109_0796 [Pirellulaceae bacterium]|nr:MAG: hypothetical protein KatS3mg109_0796 [Pirellulaceae bacterium]
MRARSSLLIVLSMLLVAKLGVVSAGEGPEGLKPGTVTLKSAGPIAFAPDGVLLIGDPVAATVYAVATGDTKGDPEKAEYRIEAIDEKVAALLGVSSSDILIADVAANPASGNVYLSVARGRGPDAQAVIVRTNPQGEFDILPLENVACAKAELPNPPREAGQGRFNQRALAITDLAYVAGSVIVAGLANEEFASTLRVLPYPFAEGTRGAGVEIYHGSHGRFETQSPIRTFTSYVLEGEPHILAAYTCTPLVKIPLKQLAPGAKVRGVTIAELGNRNQPLDMFVYSKDGKDYLLVANSRRGVMKISAVELSGDYNITQRIEGTAGAGFETLEGWTGVVHLDRLNSQCALVLSQNESGRLDLRSVPLP